MLYAPKFGTLHARAVQKKNETDSEVGGTWDGTVAGLYCPRPSWTGHCQWFELVTNQPTQPWEETAWVRHGGDGCPEPSRRTRALLSP